MEESRIAVRIFTWRARGPDIVGGEVGVEEGCLLKPDVVPFIGDPTGQAEGMIAKAAYGGNACGHWNRYPLAVERDALALEMKEELHEGQADVCAGAFASQNDRRGGNGSVRGAYWWPE